MLGLGLGSRPLFVQDIHAQCSRRIKSYWSALSIHSLHAEVQQNHPHHTHLLPSILTPEMSYPIIAMCRSVPGHRLPNWNFTYAIIRKLCLEVYDPANLPLCWYGVTHDCRGDHAFCCIKNNKKMAHDYCCSGFCAALQKPIATAGYILPTAKLELEKANLIDCDKGARPLDVSFHPDLSLDAYAPAPCPFSTVGGDVTIAPSPPATTLTNLSDVITMLRPLPMRICL